MNTTGRILTVLVTVLSLSSCLRLQTNEAFDSRGKYYSEYTISEWMSSEYGDNYSIYSQLLSSSSHKDIFSKYSNYTFVIPNNAAFRKWMSDNDFSAVESIPLEVADSVIAYLTIPEKVLSKDISAESVNVYTSLGGLPICVRRSDASYPGQLFVNKDCPVMEKAYVAGRADVVAQDTEFIDHTADFVSAVPYWKWKDQPVPPPPPPADRIAAPVLNAIEYSLLLKSKGEASVFWEDVEDASGYVATVNGESVALTENKIDFTGKFGEYTVAVRAISAIPEEKGDSDISTVVLTLRHDGDWGTGSAADPWKLYSAADWIDWAGLVTEGTSYSGQNVQLMNDIDFKGRQVPSVGINGKPFKGTFDGGNHTISNGVIDDGKVEAGLFRRATATISNLKVRKFNITGYSVGGSMARVGGFCGGNFKGTISNCHLENCNITATVISGNNNQTGGFVSFIDDSSGSTVIEGCSLTDCQITAEGAEMVGGIVGQMKNANKLIGCSVKGSSMKGLRIIGAIAGQVQANGLVEGCTVSKCKVNADTRNASALVGDLTGSVFNCISEYNTVNVGGGSSPYGAGALAGSINNGAVIANCVSRNNAVTCSDFTQVNPYLSLGIGSNRKTGLTYVAANLFIQSGTMRYEAATGNFIGIVTSILETSKLSGCYYDKTLRDNVDISEKAKARYGCGAVGDEKNVDSDGTIAVEPAQIAASSGDDALITILNNWVEANKDKYPLLKNWSMEADAPTIKL